jgi:hypothetical protein
MIEIPIKAHDVLAPWAFLVDGSLGAYAGTFSTGLVFRSQVTPNACSAALKPFDAFLRCRFVIAYSASSERTFPM